MYHVPCDIWFFTCIAYCYCCPHVHHISCKCRVMVTGQVHHQVTMDKALISNCFRHPHIALKQDLHHSKFPGFYDQVRSMPKTISMLAGRLLAICNHIASEQKKQNSRLPVFIEPRSLIFTKSLW